MINYNSSVIKTFITLLKVLGHPSFSGNGDGKIPARAIFFLSLSIFIPVVGIINVISDWSELNKRFLMLEDVSIALMCLVFITDFTFSPHNIQRLVDIMKYSTFNDYNLATKDDIRKMINKSNISSWNLFWLLYAGMVVFWGFVSGVPWYDFIIHLINKNEIDYSIAPMPFPSFIPYRINGSLILFTVYFIAQTLILAYLVFVIGLWALLGSCSLAFVSYELELLCNVINNVDDKLGISERNLDVTDMNNNYSGDGNNNGNKIDSVSQEEVKLLKVLSAIHRYHLEIIQKIKHINKAVNSSMFIYNQLICLHISMTLYCMFQNNDFSNKGKYIFAFCSTVFNYGISCVAGQFLINMSEKLWDTVLSSSWQNKPSWYKHSVRMLLIGTLKPLEMKPAGLYVLDLVFLLKVVQAAYSYCNIMLQFNKKKELLG